MAVLIGYAGGTIITSDYSRALSKCAASLDSRPIPPPVLDVKIQTGIAGGGNSH